MELSIHDPRPCDLGEGPLWHPTRKQLFWFDINNMRMMASGGEWQFDRPVSAAGWLSDAALLIATSRDLIRLDIETGAQEPVAALEADNPVTRANDGRADPWGGFWIGTMGRQAEPGAGAIYRYYQGELRQLYPGITIPNAICFSPDGAHAHFADTARRIVWRQALAEADGWPSGTPEIYLDHGADGPNPDGAVIDAAGNFCCAEWGASRLRCYAPSGAVLRDISLPVSQPTCPAFGGSDLYITTARQGLSEQALAGQPLAGQVFVARGVAAGQAEHRVIL